MDMALRKRVGRESACVDQYRSPPGSLRSQCSHVPGGGAKKQRRVPSGRLQRQ